MDILYVIEITGTKYAILLGRFTKHSSFYEYRPCSSAKLSNMVWTWFAMTDSNIPKPISIRIWNPSNLATDNFLQEIGLSEYDEWEVLKRTEGKDIRDNIRFVDRDTIRNVFGSNLIARPGRPNSTFIDYTEEALNL
ncbi:hypothetical protein D3C74_335010 [compost metagenome]